MVANRVGAHYYLVKAPWLTAKRRKKKLPPLGRILVGALCIALSVGKDPLPGDMYLVIPEVSLSFVLRLVVFCGDFREGQGQDNDAP